MTALSGRVAVVTGAGRSVGLGIARRLAAAGAAVAVNDLHADRADEAVAEIIAAGGQAVAVPFDVTDYDAVAAGVAAAAAALGPIDILVNNAGIAEGSGAWQFLTSTPQQWRPAIDINLYGSMNCIHCVLPSMVERGWGRVIQISSGAGSKGLGIGVSVYGAAKSGIEGLLRHLSVEVATTGVTVNALALGLMENIAVNAPESIVGSLVRAIPIRRLGTAAEVGAACVWLSSEEGALVTGQTIHLNGGSLNGR